MRYYEPGRRPRQDESRRGESAHNHGETDDGDEWRAERDRGPGDRASEMRGRYSPDWSRPDAEPRQSDDPYYARNRDYERSRSEESRSGEQRPDGEGSYYRGYYARQARPFSYPGGSGQLEVESWTLTGPYSGRGPKGYKRSDERLLEEACQRLERDGQIDASEIEVSAEDGVIRLRGTVPERSMKRRAEECVESVYGTRDVMNELRVAAQSETGARANAQEARASGNAGEARKATPKS